MSGSELSPKSGYRNISDAQNVSALEHYLIDKTRTTRDYARFIGSVGADGHAIKGLASRYDLDAAKLAKVEKRGILLQNI